MFCFQDSKISKSDTWKVRIFSVNYKENYQFGMGAINSIAIAMNIEYLVLDREIKIPEIYLRENAEKIYRISRYETGTSGRVDLTVSMITGKEKDFRLKTGDKFYGSSFYICEASRKARDSLT
jgi:hypothetical protein